MSRIIGIDPGRNTGIAAAIDGKLIHLSTRDFWGAFRFVEGYGQVDLVVITKVNWHGPEAAHDVGRVCREAELLAEGIARIGLKVERVHPQGKVDAEMFRRITGWEGRTNEHVLDAGMMIFGRKK